MADVVATLDKSLRRLPPEPALSLAALRVVVPLMVLLAPGFREGVRVARWDPVRWVAPEGLGWFAAHVPIDARLATAAQLVMAVSALMAAVGIYARPALATLTVATLYLFSIAQLAGHVWHDMHLLWFCALLASSPCDDVLAVDAKRPLLTEDIVYARPIWVARGLLAAIYFFPGLHKLMRSGIAWALSDNLRNQMYWKWAQYGLAPSFRLEQPAWLLPLMGISVLAFELGFPLLMFSRRTRLFAAATGFVFHIFTQVLFLIPFASLWIAYVVLVDLRPLARRLRPSLSPSSGDGRALRTGHGALAALLVQSALVIGAVVQGARGQTRSYPFACYPTFEWMAGPEMPDLIVALQTRDGREVELPSGGRGRTQREWAEVWSVAGVTAPITPVRLRAYYTALQERDPVAKRAAEGTEQVRFYRVLRSVLPDDQGRIVRRTLIGELVP
jgi:Vitamin K-dependent gamma-carboxylase